MFDEMGQKFESSKQRFFTSIGLRSREWLKSHRDLGKLWEGKLKKERWENVSEHCLVETARAEVFADFLQLSAEARQRLLAGAILHDFNKKEDLRIMKEAGGTPESYDQVGDLSTKKLYQAGIDSQVIEIANSVGHNATVAMEEILKKQQPTEQEIACLVLHYIDDYALNSEWAVPFDGKQNDLDRRMASNEANPKYSKIAAAGLYKEQRRVGILVQQKLAELLRFDRDPKFLPEFIDQVIVGKIESLV